MEYCDDCQVKFIGISCPSCDLQFQQEIEALDEEVKQFLPHTNCSYCEAGIAENHQEEVKQ